MANLRDKIFKKINGVTTKIPLNTDQSSGYETNEIESGIFDVDKIRVIHHGGVATSQDLLHVVEDLVENDRRINNEKNAGHSILCDGVFSEEGANFDIDVITSTIQKNIFYGFNVLHGKIKTDETVYQITEDCERALLSLRPSNPTQEEIEIYSIPDLTNAPTGYFRRDYLSVVYFDNSTGASTVPVWRYVAGDALYSEPPVKHKQKIYADGEVGELWPLIDGKVDSLSQPARFKEYIIYSFLYVYDGKGSWNLLTSNSGKTFPLTPTPNEYFELLEYHNENVNYEHGLYKYITGTGWTFIDTNQYDGDAFPDSPIDLDILKCTGDDKLAKGWYQFVSANKYTKLKKIDLIPNYSGIADLVNFRESKLVPYENNGVNMYRVGYGDRQFYHPYLKFTPLETEYGQGDSTSKEGVTCLSNKYIANSLNDTYKNLNDVDSSLFNFPFMISSVDDSFNVQESVELDHVMLGYKKEGWWNRDYIQITTDDKYYKVVNGKWAEVTPLATNSAFPKSPATDDIFEMLVSGISTLYKYNGSSWIVEPNKRYGKNFPLDAADGDFFEIRNSSIPAIANGMYQYNSNIDGNNTGSWGAYFYNTVSKALEFFPMPTGVHNQSYAEYPEDIYNGRVFYANGNGSIAKGWYIYNVNTFIPINAGYGDRFPGGNDLNVTDRWNKEPQTNEYFKATGEGNASKGWWKKQPTYWERVQNVSIGNKAILTSDFPLDNDSLFVSNGEDVANGKPVVGVYEFSIGDWYRIPHASGHDFPIYNLKNDLHFYLSLAKDGFLEGLYKYVEGGFIDKTTMLIFGSPTGGTLIDVLPALNTMTATEDGKYFHVNTGELDGWYQYQHSTVPASCRFNNLAVAKLTYLPTYKLVDEAYVDVDGVLYQYNDDLAYWKFIPDSLSNLLDSPPSGVADQYIKISGVNENYPAGFYRFSDSKWNFNPLTKLTELPALEDDVTVDIVQLQMFTGVNGEIDVDVIKADLISRVEGKWDIEVAPALTSRTKLGAVTRNVAANDIIIISNGIGHYQTGYITAINGTVITVKGLYSDIEDALVGRSKAVFCSPVANTLPSNEVPNGYVSKGTATLKKVDIMAQIDEIDNYSSGIDLSIDETDFGKRIDAIHPFYQIKVALPNDTIVNKNNWCMVRTKATIAEGNTASLQAPKILIADQSITNQTQRNGYISVRYKTVEGKYPYYGVDEDGEIDKINKKYLVLEDTFDGNNWTEIQTLSNARQKDLGFPKFKVVAKNLDDENAIIVYDELSNKEVHNEIYFDVVNGRIMFHPEVYTKYKLGDGRAVRASFIILNVLKGNVTADSIVFNDLRANKQTTLYDKIVELENAAKSTGDGRKIFNYRGKFAQIYQIDEVNKSKGVVLTQGVADGTDTVNDDLFMCHSNGNPIGPEKIKLYQKLYPKSPISLFCKGDDYTTNLFNYNEGFFKDGDCFKLINSEDNTFVWKQYVTDAWVTVGAPTSDLAFPESGYVLPEHKYTPLDNTANKTKFVLGVETTVTPEASRVIKSSAIAFSVTDDYFRSMSSVRYIGIQVESLGSNWDNLCAYVQAGNSQASAEIKIPRATVTALLGNVALSTKDKWLYIPFEDTFPLEDGMYYHMHLYVDNLNGGVAPTILGYYDADAPAEELRRKIFFKLMARGADKSAGYPDADVFSLLYTESGDIAHNSKLIDTTSATRNSLDVINVTTNLPLCESNDYNFVVPVDFSNMTIWDKWGYAGCIGYDAILGRIKFPSRLDSKLYSVEFNANWGDKNINSKSLSLFSNPNASVEDVFNMFQTYNDLDEIMTYVDQRIARFSPRGKSYTAVGGAGEQFLLDFVPSGYILDEDGLPIYEGNEYLGSDAAKKSLIVTVNGVFRNPDSYELDGKILTFNVPYPTVGQNVYIRGAEYKVLSTVADESITPDHFSMETQNLFTELKNIRDEDFPNQLAEAKASLLDYVRSVMQNSVEPQCNIFRINSGNIQRWNDVTLTWKTLGTLAGGMDYLTLTWDPYAQKSLQIYKNNTPISMLSFTVENYNEVNFTVTPIDGDVYEIKGNIIREAVTSNSMAVAKEDVFDDFTGTKTTFACSFFARNKDEVNVFVEGIYNSKKNYNLIQNKVAAFANGDLDLSLGHNWALQNESFQIAVDDGVNGVIDTSLKTIILNENCADLAAVIAHLNTKFAQSNLDLNLVAEVRNTNFLRLKTVRTGLEANIVLVNTPTHSALASLGLLAGKYIGQNGTITIEIPEGVPQGHTVVIKTVDVTDAGIMGIQASLQEQIDDVNDKLNIINLDAPALMDSFAEVQHAYTDLESAVMAENAALKLRVELTESKNLEQELRMEYLEGRQQAGSNRLLDLFLDNKFTDLKETTYSKTAKLLKDLDFNNSWKNRQGKVDFTQGLIKNDDQPFYLEEIDQFNLEDIGQAQKGSIKYDSANNCYWMISAVSINGIGEITKISTSFIDGRIEVMGKWYLPIPGLAGRMWSGICVNSTGTRLWFCFSGTAVNTNFIYSVKINDNGTLGEANYAKKNGETIDLVYSTPSLGGALNSGHQIFTGTSSLGDLIDWSEDEIAYLYTTTTGGLSSIQFLNKSFLETGTSLPILGFGHYVPYVGTTFRSMCLNGRDLYIRVDDTIRFIYKFNLDTDIKVFNGVANPVVFKASARVETFRNVVGNGSGGICIGHHGDMLEVSSTVSNGYTLVRRSLKNALMAENQISGEKKLNSTNAVLTSPVALMIDPLDGSYYTADLLAAAGAVRISRYKQDGTKQTITGTIPVVTGIRDMTTDGTSVWFITNTATGTLVHIYKMTLQGLRDALDTVATTSDDLTAVCLLTGAPYNLVQLTSASLLNTNTDLWYGICYNSDDSILYLVNSTGTVPTATAKIDTLTTDNTPVLTKGVYDLPVPTNVWSGIAYKNGNIYVKDFTYGVTPDRIFVIPKNKANASYMWRSHIYQDPSTVFAASTGTHGMDFDGNDLVVLHVGHLKFYKMKTLEDPDVLQLHNFIDYFNVLGYSAAVAAGASLFLCGNIVQATGIVERTFAPEEFTEQLKYSRINSNMLLYHGGYRLGIANVLNGIDWSVSQQITVNDGTTAKTITLSANTASIQAAVDHINTQLATATASKAIAFIYNDVYIGIRNTAEADLTLTNVVGTPMATLGWGSSPTVYTYANSYYIKTTKSQRNVPDKNYAGVIYGDNGFSLLMLDKFLSGRSSTGKPRYDVRDIVAKHYTRGANNILPATFTGSAIFIVDDMIVVGNSTAAQSGVWIDLKAGKAVALGGGIGGKFYNGYLSERNDGKGWDGTINPEIIMSSDVIRKIHGRTFTKNDISGYSGETNRTIISIGNDGGNDILDITWDANGERSLVRVVKNIMANGAFGPYGVWIAPSGYIILGNAAATTTGAIFISTKPIWELGADGFMTVLLGAAREVGVNITGGIVKDISVNSRCWKTASGQWRHQILVGCGCGAVTGTNGTFRMIWVDVENNTTELVYTGPTINASFENVDSFEDRVFFSITSTGNTGEYGMYKKFRFNDKLDTTLNYNGWTKPILMSNLLRPRINSYPNALAGTSYVCRYSKNQGILLTGSSVTGVLFNHFNRIHACKHVSTEIEVSPEVTEVYYKENVVEG